MTFLMLLLGSGALKLFGLDVSTDNTSASAQQTAAVNMRAEYIMYPVSQLLEILQRCTQLI